MTPQQQRQAQLLIRTSLLQRLIPLWNLLDTRDLQGSFARWLQAVAPLILESRGMSATVAANYYRDTRSAAGIDGTAPVQLASRLPVEQLHTAMLVTTVVAIRTAFGAGQSIDQALQTGFVTSSGAATRLALQGGRQTIVDTVKADPHAVGWDRVTSDDPCAFCAMLASRGAVYRSEETASFESHDHCSCSAEPVFSPADVKPAGKAAEWDRVYQDHAAGTRDQLRNFRRAYEGRASS